jgi:hypothetical protein
LKASSWDVSGSAVAEAAKAVAELYCAYVPEPCVVCEPRQICEAYCG